MPPLLEQPLIRAGKRTRTKAKSWNVGCANVPKYQIGHTHLQTHPEVRSIPKKFELVSIHLQPVGIVDDMYAVTAANYETGNVLPMSKEDHGAYIMGVTLT